MSTLRIKYLTLTSKRQVWWRRWVVTVRCLRQYVEQPEVSSCDVFLNVTNAGNIMSKLGASGLKTATAERSHTADIYHCIKMMYTFLISNFRLILNVVCFLLGNSPTSEFYMHIKFRHRGITQKKAYNMMYTV